jgi:hypothetical protein
MPDYANGKIYRIVCNETGEQYIGSTTYTLAERLHTHRQIYRNIRSRDIIVRGNYEMVLIENYPCETKQQLEIRERHYIESLPCVNHVVPTRTLVEYREANKEAKREYNKQYREANKEAFREYKKQYREANKEAIHEYSKQYYEANKEAIHEYYKQWREANKEAKREYNRQWREANKDTIREYNKQWREAKKSTQQSAPTTDQNSPHSSS